MKNRIVEIARTKPKRSLPVPVSFRGWFERDKRQEEECTSCFKPALPHFSKESLTCDLGREEHATSYTAFALCLISHLLQLRQAVPLAWPWVGETGVQMKSDLGSWRSDQDIIYWTQVNFSFVGIKKKINWLSRSHQKKDSYHSFILENFLPCAKDVELTGGTQGLWWLKTCLF